VDLNLQNTLVVVVFCIKTSLGPAASCQVAGICCQLCLAIMQVLAGLCKLTELVVGEATASTDALILPFVEAILAEVDSDALVVAYGVAEALALANE
jgi:hypothetical protein